MPWRQAAVAAYSGATGPGLNHLWSGTIAALVVGAKPATKAEHAGLQEGVVAAAAVWSGTFAAAVVAASNTAASHTRTHTYDAVSDPDSHSHDVTPSSESLNAAR